MIRRLAIVIVAVAALAIAAGVAGAVTGSSKVKPTEITIWVGWAGSTHELGFFKKLVA